MLKKDEIFVKIKMRQGFFFDDLITVLTLFGIFFHQFKEWLTNE
jgi:hypothetical protein